MLVRVVVVELVKLSMVVMFVGLVQVYNSKNLGMFQQEERITTGKM